MQWNEVIKALREDHDLTQKELGKVFNVNQITISQYERGVRQINPSLIIAYAKYFNVSTDYILGLTKNPSHHWIAKNNISITNNYGNINMN